MRRVEFPKGCRVAALVLVLAACPAALGAQEAGPDPALEAIVAEANQERENAIREREQKVAEAEARLTALRAEIADLVARNTALREELSERAAQVAQAENDRLAGLIKVYESMEPEEAAAILDHMAEPVALAVFAGMKGRAAAGIMGFMPEAKAARLGERLARAR